MVGIDDRSARQSTKALPPAASGSVHGVRVLMAIVFVLIAIASVTGVVFAMASGQPTAAIAIGLVAGAFFCGVAC